MDFVVIEIFYLLWFSLTLGTFGGIIEPYPKNQAVPEGTENVTIKCFCSGNPDTIKWSMNPVGSIEGKIIKDGTTITDNAYDGTPDSKGKSYTLTVRKASSSTAGTYACEQNAAFYVLLIVLHGEATCNRIPRDTSQLPCDSTLQLSCTFSYIADDGNVEPVLQWTPKVDNAVNDSPMSGGITTATSRLNVTWPKEGDIPTYTCTATFTLTDGAKQITIAKDPPADPSSCLPFASPSDVPCIDKNGNLRPPSPSPSPQTTENPEQSKDDSSVRSAETSNLAIQVLGVAGVLLLAQMF